VRTEAAEALRKIHTESALQVLIDSVDQADARVRNKITIELGSFFNEKAASLANKVLITERNPDIRHNAARSLGAYPAEEHRDALLAALKSDSFEELVAEGAISGLVARRDPGTLDAIIAEIKSPKNDFNSRGFASALLAVGTLGSDLENKDAAYHLLIQHATDLRNTVRLGAIRALGILQDPRAIGVLTNLATGPAEAAETTAAKRSIEQIRAARPSGNELQTLRTEVLDLKKQNADLKKSFEELKKQFQAREQEPGGAANKRSKKSPPPSAGKGR
jgi:aminopeptidase N